MSPAISDRPADPEVQAEHAVSAAWPPVGRRSRHRAMKVAAIVLVFVIVVIVLAVTDPSITGHDKSPTTGVIDNTAPTSTVVVTRQDLSAHTSESATLGYAGSYSVVNQAQGTLTALPAVGQVVSQGQVLYQVSGAPVVLLDGSTPAYRDLSEGSSPSDVTGPDVAELNADLVALGYATATQIPAGSDKFTWWTKYAVEKLQKALGVTQSGTFSLGQVVILPTALRVTAVSATLGSPAEAGQAVFAGTSTTRQVTIALNAAQQSEVKVGQKVSIVLPGGTPTPGVVASVGTVAVVPQGGGSPTITVEVTPSDPAATGSLDQAPVNVTITTASVANALVVPVDALLALSGGGYAVEVIGAGGARHLVDVSLGLFDDANGRVQVTNSGLVAGQRIVVPSL